MPDQQYFMARLHGENGRLVHSQGRPGSVSVDPHKAFRHQIRREWEKYPDFDTTRRGLMYAIWTLPMESRKWNADRAFLYAWKNVSEAEVYIVSGSYTWESTLVAVHPANPIIFQEV